MLPASPCCPARSPKRAKVLALYALILLLCVSAANTHSTATQHNVDNRSPEIDPFWYVGRGVRPIGRFGKRQYNGNRSPRPAVNSLDLLLNSLRNHEARRPSKTFLGEQSYWLP